jgi:sec-independent protein translocase protein TatA
MLGISPGELMVIFFIIILLFGAKKLPELARSLGKSMSEFRNSVNSVTDELKNDFKPNPENKK